MGKVKQAARLAVRGHPFLSSIVWLRPDTDRVVLTFDDGPNPNETPAILDALDEHECTASFFLLLDQASEHPDLVREVRDRGHDVCLHGMNHDDLTAKSFREVVRLLRTGKRQLEEIVEQPVRWFRPPYGRMYTATYLAARTAGLDVVLWSSSTDDWMELSLEEMSARALDPTGAGAIVLAHEWEVPREAGRPGFRTTPLQHAELVGRLAEDAARQGLVLASLSEALTNSPAVRRPRFTRHELDLSMA